MKHQSYAYLKEQERYAEGMLYKVSTEKQRLLSQLDTLKAEEKYFINYLKRIRKELSK